MATRKPLVRVDGEIVQLPSGDSLFGGVGEGVPVSPADATAAFQAMLNDHAGKTLDLAGATYRITSTIIVPSNTTIQNGTIDATGLPTSGLAFYAGGSLGAPVSFTGGAKGSTSITTSLAGVVAGTVLCLRSSNAFGDGTQGEYWEARGAVGSIVTGIRRIFGNYTTSPTVRIATQKQNITFRNLKCIGDGDTYGQTLFEADIAKNIIIEGCTSTGFADAHWRFKGVQNFHVSNCYMAKSDDATGTAYGVVIVEGCDQGTISNCSGVDMRHGVSVGGTLGVDRFITVTGCTFTGCTDAAIDTHPQVQFMSISGNSLDSGGVAGTGMDGLVVQGADCSIIGNVVRGFQRHGILLQPICADSTVASDFVVTGNLVKDERTSATESIGIIYSSESNVGTARLVISNNVIELVNTGSSGIYVQSSSVSSNGIRGVVINGNSIYTREVGISVSTAASKYIRGLVIDGNSVETLATAFAAISINSTTANYIEMGLVTGNFIYGGLYGISATNTVRVVANGNMIQGFSSAALNGITGVNNTTT